MVSPIYSYLKSLYIEKSGILRALLRAPWQFRRRVGSERRCDRSAINRRFLPAKNTQRAQISTGNVDQDDKRSSE